MQTLRAARLGTGKTLRQVSSEARISIGSLSEYERNIGSPKGPTRLALSLVLGVPEDELLWPETKTR